jgi:hypothetical protein
MIYLHLHINIGLYHSGTLSTITLRTASNTGQFKKKVTLSHVYNEVTSAMREEN